MTSAVQLAIATNESSRLALVQSLSRKLNRPVSKLDSTILQLVVGEKRIEIRSPDLGNPIFIDFATGKNAHRRQFGGGRGQPLAKALGLKKGVSPTIIDATAGFARDAFVLANLGCTVTLIERNPFIATLIGDALQRAQSDAEIYDVIQRMSLINDDAVNYLSNLPQQQKPEVIYMDPMYPCREKSALVKKDMRLLHQLAGPDTDSEELLAVARHTALKRVVVKRPKSADFVRGEKPAAGIESKSTRYDIYPY